MSAAPFVPHRSRTYRPLLAWASPEDGIPYLVEVDLVVRRPHHRHQHQETQVLWVLSGGIGMEVGQTLHELGPGSGCVLAPGTVHRVVRLRGGPERAALIDLRLSEASAGPMLRYVRGSGGGPVYRGEAAAVLRAAEAVRAAARQGARGTARLMAGLWELLAELRSSPANGTAGSSKADGSAVESAATAEGASEPGPGAAVTPDRRLAMAEQFLRDHLPEAIGVEHVAAHVGLSRSQLTRLYLFRFGVPPASRLRALRVERAVHLLRSSTLSVKEVARVCGFASPHHFSRVFLEVTGRRPSEERRGA